MSIFHRKTCSTSEGSEQYYWTLGTLLEYILTIIASNETRYSERFEASQSDLHANFLNQQEKMQTALTAQKLVVDTALEADDRAVTKAERDTEKRFESVNEFRSTLSDQQSTFMPRLETMALFKAADEKLASSQIASDRRFETLLVNVEKTNDTVTRALADLRLAMTHFLSTDAYETRHGELQRQVNELRESRSEISGKSAGANSLWGIWLQ